MKPWDERTTPETGLRGIVTKLNQEFAAARRRQHHRLPAAGDPRRRQRRRLRLQAGGAGRPVAGRTRAGDAFLHRGGEFRSGHRLGLLDLLRRSARPLSSTSTASAPQRLNVPISTIFNTLQTQLGSAYVNNFNDPGPGLPGQRAGGPAISPEHPDDILKIYVRSTTGAMVPPRAVATAADRPAADAAFPLQPVHQRRRSTARRPPADRSGQAMAALTEARADVAAAGLRVRMVRASPTRKHLASSATIVVFALAIVFGLSLPRRCSMRAGRSPSPSMTSVVRRCSAPSSPASRWWKLRTEHLRARSAWCLISLGGRRTAIPIMKFASKESECNPGRALWTTPLFGGGHMRRVSAPCR